MLNNLKLIYKPKGRAREYAPLALDIYDGCTHKCKYCYVSTNSIMNSGTYFGDAAPKKDVITRLEHDLIQLRELDNQEEILLSFRGDVYQPAELELGLTRKVVALLVKYEQPFTILTKGGQRACRDFDLVKDYPKFRFGTTLIFCNQELSDEWEPGAASIFDRIRAIEIAKALGIDTWVSIEPVIQPSEALLLIDQIHPIVDAWKVGKINHWPELEKAYDWIDFRKVVKEKFELLSSTYYLKKSLTDL